MITTRTAGVLLCAVLTAASRDGSPRGLRGSRSHSPISLHDHGSPKGAKGPAGYPAQGGSPIAAISPTAAERLRELSLAAKDEPMKAFTAYADESEDCTLLASEGVSLEEGPRRDAYKITMKREYAQKQSTILATMLEDGGDEELPLPNVKLAILKQVVKYMNYHGEHPDITTEIQKPLKSTNLAECGVDEWDVAFVADTNLSQEELFEVILAANFMDIKSLLDLACAKVASMIKGKNTQEIREQFNIVNDFTPEEEAQVREENRWAEDA